MKSYDLNRFSRAQERDYVQALREIRAGRKASHWMWYIFPQLRGLGYSSTAQYYGIEDLDEARAYLADPLLRARLEEISSALLGLEGRSAEEIMGWPDVLKLCSSMTLFSRAAGSPNVYEKVLEKYYQGREDRKTLSLLGLD